MESEEKKLDTKLKQLAIAVHRTKQVLDSGKKESIKRHLQALRETVRETNETKRAVESAKIAKNDKIEEINVWNDEIETKLEQADADIFTLEKWISDKERSEDIAAQEERFNLELKLHEKKLKMQHELALSKTEPEIQECTGFKTAKLPKLVISKYDGSYMDWSRFWGQFTEAIDKSSIPPITKFTYLRELLSPKVRRSVEALPFSAEGYNRAKSILADRYGKESEIINSYVKEILELPYITNANTRKIAEFSEKLSYCVQALETMKRLDYVQGNVAMTLEKLAGIRGDLVRTDPDWESWDFGKLSEALRQWVKRNPVVTNDKDRDSKPLFNARGEDAKIKGCVYCGDTEHKATQCNKVTESSERKKILARKGLCFNCATRKHRASDCSSKVSCQHCSKRHHSSICEKRSDKPGEEQKLMTDGASDDGVFPVVVVKVNGVKCRALIDSGAGGSYASAKLIKMIDKQPNEIKTQRIDMLMASKTTRIEMYDTEVSSLDENFKLNVRVSKVDKPELLTVNNPRYDQIVQKYDHLQSVTMDDRDTKEKLPIHLVLGNGEYARVKTSTKPLVSGKDGEPVAEKTKLGWVIMSPGIDFDRNTMLMTQTTQYDFENLCRLDVLGLADVKENDQSSVYEDFKEQLVRNPTGYYEANLPWKSNHPPLPTNEAGSRRRLTTLVKKLKREGNYEQYNDIIREQLDQGIIEVAPEGPTTKEFYLPHKAVVKKSAETTKLRIVYDASAKEQNNQPSLNECINPGPPLQNLLWGILIRSRFHPVLLTSDIQKAFLQVRIKEQERDALRFFWQSPESDELTVYRFTRALFGLTCSPFLLGGVINEHLKIWEAKYPELVKEIRDNLYVDDLITGGENVESVAAKRMEAIEVFEDATFRLHKWHSNVPALENHVSTDQNPADLGSRGGRCVENQLWQRGPDWLSDPDKWPPNLTLEPSEETRAEAKIIKNVFATTATTSDRDELDKLLEAHELVRVLRIGAWIRRFVNNCKRPVGQRETGPLRAAEIQDQYLWWCKRVQQETAVQDEVEKARIPLNLQPNDDGILECRGRIEGEYPVFLPRSHLFTQKLVHRAHESTLHGGESMTMAKVRERFWVPSLRQLVKRVRSDCWGCKRFRAKSYENPPPAKLPTTRTQGSIPFEVLGVDFAGPIRYRTRGKTTKKAYLVLYGCSLTRAVHLEVLRSLELNEFLSSLKRFIARRGRPRLIYSDNGATFKAAEKWLKGVQRDEQLNFFLSERAIEWKFNLSRAPWWGGQYERLIGLFKRAFYKTIGNGILTLNELEDVVLDVEVALNNRPLSYLEDDVELPVLTPSSMLSINPNQLPESKSSLLEEKDLRKRAKFIKRCKLAMWKRWSREYVRSLRERHVNVAGKQASCPRKGSAVIVQDESKNRNVWKLGIVTDLIKGKDDVVRGAKVRTAKGELERAVQHLYPLELSCEVKKWEPNPDVASFVPRPKRDAAAAANLRMQQHAQEERREQ